MKGSIKSCSKAGCNYKCCDFNQGNYIVLFPNEFEYAEKKGFSLNHLRIIDKIEGNGFKALCNAKNRVKCDNGYKPIDCKIYPVFPIMNDTYILKGKKCPLAYQSLKIHVKKSKHHIQNLPFIEFKELKKWLQFVQLVDYEVIPLNNEY
ncbi:hypothetical protein [uncultured Aquimarina sp.]|uniref:hypothetical protein n=1 Tax=uncultured Aquimarina sp. TaxID=575652 RepID=UPI002625AAF3|nr:hypothetical protein [uncultured Aquimarina sp.]